MKHVAVVGTGLAGLYAARRLSELNPEVQITLITKGDLGESNSAWAQGGLSVVTAETDSVASHVADTLAAGAGLCWPEAVQVLCSEGPERLQQLLEWDMQFDRVDGSFALGLEAAHSQPRILHARGDATGAALVAQVSLGLLGHQVDIREHTLLVDLLVENGQLRGVRLLDADGLVDLEVDALILASGGAGQLFRHTTNPTLTTGDGVAAAFRAGAVLADLEMYQFHPTALAVPGSFLISEAVRGEGAVLIDQHGHRFMPELDKRAELAPRDVVARGIQQTMIRQGGQPVLLDATALGEQHLAERFPAITKACRRFGLNWGREPIPVTPAAHYWMGGVATDTYGRSSIPGLFVIGEAACTGAHGANRLASNSLLETVVFAERAVQSLLAAGSKLAAEWPTDAPAERWQDSGTLAELRIPVASRGTHSGEEQEVVDRVELQTLLWDSVGLARTEPALFAAIGQLNSWRPASLEHRVFSDWEDANLLELARVVTASARAREESRGAHFRLDYPATVADANRPVTVVREV